MNGLGVRTSPSQRTAITLYEPLLILYVSIFISLSCLLTWDPIFELVTCCIWWRTIVNSLFCKERCNDVAWLREMMRDTGMSVEDLASLRWHHSSKLIETFVWVKWIWIQNYGKLATLVFIYWFLNTDILSHICFPQNKQTSSQPWAWKIHITPTYTILNKDENEIP